MKTTTLIFDWGNTLMRVFPEFDGPMVGWPCVEAVPNVQQALEGLAGRYRLVVATNAGASGAPLVRAALDRVQLGSYFSDILTAKDLRANKPEPEFFTRVLRALDCPAEAALMIGDGYANDVLGARAVGMRTAWYNPGHLVSPGLLPMQEIEFTDMCGLPKALSGSRLPGPEECLAWLNEQNASEGLVAHCQAVAAAAYFLAVRLGRIGIEINPVLAHRGGLLHDLDKLTCDGQGLAHGEYSARLLREKGLLELAEIAGRHLLYTILTPECAPQTWEQRLVFYADKLVERSSVVSMPERLNALIRRYPGYAAQILACREPVSALEQTICQVIGTTPDALVAELQQAINKNTTHS